MTRVRQGFSGVSGQIPRRRTALRFAASAGAPVGISRRLRSCYGGRMRGYAARMEEGPYRAEDVRPGDPYEISHGHRLDCAPTGGSGAGPNAFGASVVGWDPAVEEVGVDPGYSPSPTQLRAPDVAVGNVPNLPGWIPGAPVLAIEYADIGQDEKALQEKIRDLLTAGTKLIWVVRLTGPRRVEVHRPGARFQTALPGERLAAPGILQNDVLVESLYDRSAAERATLTNLLQRRGYDDLEAVLREGRKEGVDEGQLKHARAVLRRTIEKRGIALSAEMAARIDACTDLARLDDWHDRALDARTAEDVLGSADVTLP